MTDNNRALLAHLFRRAGFGLRPRDAHAFPLGDFNATVEALLSPAPGQRDDQLTVLYDAGGDDMPTLQWRLADAQAEWMRMMVTTGAPLVERMVLFWSNHFATGYFPKANVNVTALVHQQAMIRRHVLGNFAALTHAMVEDLAMACWLNNDRNVKESPNENFSRELMELFVLGTGNYSERDVKELARALTGYRLQQVLVEQPSLVYDPKGHDDGEKTILGVTAKFTPHQAVDLLLAQPAAKRFVATKLVTHFVSPNADPVLVGTVAKALGNWEIKPALRAIFHSEQFRSEAVRNSVAKMPAEFVVGIMRGLQRSEFDEGAFHAKVAGQSLFNPPSVAGWPTGKRVLGPGSALARYNAAASFASRHVRQPAPNTPRTADVAQWMDVFGMTSLSQPTSDAIAAYTRDAARQPTALRVAGVLTILLSSPDYNLA